MTYELLIADRGYSSWSLRGWLLFTKFDVPVRVKTARLYTPAFAAALADFAPARTVPVARTPDGHVVPDSLAIAETLAEVFRDKPFWPEEPGARIAARALVAEMHSGYGALRSACPMNLRLAYLGFAPDAAVRADLARIEALWAYARNMATDGPWLFGAYSVADAFFAPIAARIAGYGLSVGKPAAAYVAQHLADPDFRRWRAMGMIDGADQPTYDKPYTQVAWPGPKPLIAKAVAGVDAENTTCPYSGKPVTHVLELDGRRFGFCNAFCRDKTIADPEAWPAFMKIYHS